MALHGMVRLLWMFFTCAGIIVTATQPGAGQEAQLCLSRVAPLPKAEGYGALCTSIEALYRQQHDAASSLLALKEEGDRTRATYAALEQRNQYLETRNLKLKELEQHEANREVNREKSWQAAAEKLQTDVAGRSEEAEKNFEAGVTRRETMWQRTVRQKLHASLVDRDAQWKATVQRLVSQKQAAEGQAIAFEKQEEAIYASTSASRRTALLALSRDKQRIHAGSKEVHELMEQIKALQQENAQLVRHCV